MKTHTSLTKRLRLEWRKIYHSSLPFQDPRSKSHQYSHASLPRNTRISVPQEVSSPVSSPYHTQPIISRISIPPTSTLSRQHRPIPLSVIMRLQNPYWGAMSANQPRMAGEADKVPYPPAVPMPREFFKQPVLYPHQHPPELRQPVIYSDGITHLIQYRHTPVLCFIFAGPTFTNVLWLPLLQCWTLGI